MSDQPSRLSLEAAHLWHKITGQRARAQKAAKDAFAAAVARLGPGDIAIDLGANVGEFTTVLAQTGARVFAFEPDPHAFDLLSAKVGAMPNVTLIQAAAGTEDSTAQLFRKSGFEREPDRATKSSSLFADKANVATENAVQIEIRNFPVFLQELNHNVALIKIDIEGAEVPLLEVLLSQDVAARIGEIYVETHERKLPQLAARTQALIQASQHRTAPRINWDWH